MAASQAANPTTSPNMTNAPSFTPALVQSSSDVSVMTIETDRTSSASVNGELDRYPGGTPPHLAPPTREASSVDDKVSTDGSAMSGDASELNRASKRTSSGTVKGLLAGSQRPAPKDGGKEFSASEVCSPPVPLLPHAHNLQLSVQLKTRLKYAMVKIQNGWEKQSIDQLETLAAAHSPPVSAPRMSRHSSSSSEAYLMSPIVQTTPPQHSSRLLQSHGRNNSTNSIPGSLHAAHSHQPPSLAPAPQITSRRSGRRSTTSRAPPSLSRANFHSSPVTPDTRLPTSALLSCNLQNQAEKDAVDSLLFMSSPNNSNNLKYSRESAALGRPKRVGFESPPDLR
jgi:hypothetical protein